MPDEDEQSYSYVPDTTPAPFIKHLPNSLVVSAVRVTEQSFRDTQQAQARENIGVSFLSTTDIDTLAKLNAILTDAELADTSFCLARGNHTGTQAWSTLTGTPTTLAGYGITDALALAGGVITIDDGVALNFADGSAIRIDGSIGLSGALSLQSGSLAVGILSTSYGGTGLDTDSLIEGNFLYTTATGVFGSTPVTGGARTLLAVGTLPAMRLTLGAAKSHVIDVTDPPYNAVGDGVTDDTAALQDAIFELEGDPDKTTLDLGSGTYLCSTLTTETTPQTSKRFLKLGAADLAGRDIIITGNGARIVFAAGSEFFTGLWALGKFRSLTITSGVTFEKDSTVSTATNQEPNYRCLVLVSVYDDRDIEHITFGCNFINGHQAFFLYGKGRNTRGKVKQFTLLPGSQILNPYGPNIDDATLPYGGGQQYICDPWVDTENVHGCYFNGGWDGAENETLNPTLRVKDGSTFTGARRLNFTGNTCLHHGVEAIYPVHNWTILDQVNAVATVPTVGSTVECDRNGVFNTTFIVGEIVYVDTLGTFEVISSTSSKVTLENIDATPGGAMNGKIIYENAASPCRAVVSDNTVDMTLPTGSTYDSGREAIVSQVHTVVTGNTIRGAIKGIETFGNIGAAAFNHSEGTIITGNFIELSSNTGLTNYAYGIENHVGGAMIADNVVRTPVAHRIGGIITLYPATLVNNDVRITGSVAANGYSDADRCVGIGTWGTTANGTILRGNRTEGFDVGAGPLVASASDSVTVVSHLDLTSVLPVDTNAANYLWELIHPNKAVALVQAYRSTDQTITTGSYQTIVFNTEVKDTDAIYNPSTGETTIKASGDYDISAQVFGGGISTTATVLAVFVGASQVCRLVHTFSTAGVTAMYGATVTFPLVAGNVVTVRMFHDGATSMTVTGASTITRFTISRRFGS